MKKSLKAAVSLGICMSMLTSVPAFAAHPKGFWPYVSAFNTAKDTGDKQQMVTTGEALLKFYSGLPLDEDVAGVRYNVYYNIYEIYDSMGYYDKEREALNGVIEAGTFLNYNDAVIMAKRRLEKIDSRAEVYALTDNNSVYFGAKNEPASGTLYGRVWGSNNEADMKNEGICSFYIELGSGHDSADAFDWKISEFDDGNRAIHIALNFPNESGTVAEVNSGSLDSKINDTLSYIATLKGPVFLRIGAEMNVWTNRASADDYKAAYSRIARMARATAPNAALVFSPSYSSAWGETADQYFPGADIVDWIGTSLYINKYQSPSSPSSQGDVNDMYFGLNQYADAVKNLDETVELSKKYNKPIIISEGGSGYGIGEDLSGFAANRVTEMYTTLNMVYPQIKAIIYFDTNQSGFKYSLNGNSTINAAYKAAIASNKSLKSSVSQQAPSYAPLGKVTTQNSTLTLGAYCDVINQSVSVTYYVDGNAIGSSASMPFSCQLSLSGLSAGTHSVKAEFKTSNGYTQVKNYNLTKNENGLVSIVNA